MLDVDMVIVGDFRFPGGTSMAIASEIDALASAGYKIALVALTSPFLSKRRSFNQAIRTEIEEGHAVLVAPGQAVRARLTCLHHPVLFENFPAQALKITTDELLLIVHHPPIDAAGVDAYDVAKVEDVIRSLFPKRVVWAPVGPKVRTSLQRLPYTPPLTQEDWVNTLNPARFSGPRDGLLSGRPIVGRHSRPERPKWPDTVEKMCAAYPDSPDIMVRLMGFEQRSLPELTDIPQNWDVQPFGAEAVPKFLNSIDFFSYYHHSDWIEAFGRTVIEAMASGAVCILPKHFEELFQEGAVYCKPEEVREKVLSFQQNPAKFRNQSAAGFAMVEERFSPEVAMARVRARIGPPAKFAEAPALSKKLKPRVMYFTSNGIGMGHITRSMAAARRHRDLAEPIVVSMSRAYSIARREGMIAEYIPFFRSSGMNEKKWHQTLREELTEIFRFYQPNAVVLDSNVPYIGVRDALEMNPGIWSVWMRRAMWPPGVGAHFLEHHNAFDAVIEPGEFARTFDRGLTLTKRKDALQVPPISYLFKDEALPRGAARTVLGLDQGQPAVFLQLGSGNNMDTAKLLHLIVDKLTSDINGDTPQIVVGEWDIGLDRIALPKNVIPFRGFPFARFLNAFDYAVALAGYNTFHENLRAGLPTLFLGNEHPEQDEQWLRAEFAQVAGYALAARSNNPYTISEKLFELSNSEVQAAFRAACHRLPSDNGADNVARFLSDIVYTRKLHPAQGVG